MLSLVRTILSPPVTDGAGFTRPSFKKMGLRTWFLPARDGDETRGDVHGAQVSKNQRLRVVNPDCAGIDIGKDRHFVAVDPERTEEPVRSFGAFTRDLEEMAAWLASCGVTKVAMESTSVYWIAVYETLERAGFEVMLVPPRMTKQIGGRKSDVLDCQWIWQLMSYGLLRGAFRPGDEVCPLRSYARQMRRLTEEPLPLRPAHAQGADRDERQARLGDRQHHGTDRPAHPARDHRRRA